MSDEPLAALVLEGRRANGLTPEAAASLTRQGFVLYHEALARPRELRGQPRARTRLHSAKILDADNSFLCEAVLQDVSAGGMRLLLARNIGLPPRFGVHDDQSAAIYTVSQAWRRGLAIGVRIHVAGPPRPMAQTERAALRGRYYAVRG
jgi:hypothetical protein